MATESRIDAANEEMAVIADTEGDGDKRTRLRDIWQPIAFELIDKSLADVDDCHGLLRSDPNFVGVTCDTLRPVFLKKQTSASGFVYRRFTIGGRQIARRGKEFASSD